MLAEESPIADFYPRTFTTDANGKRQPWEAVVKIPFISGERLLEVVNNLDADELNTAEKRRNMRGKDMVYVPSDFQVKK